MRITTWNVNGLRAALRKGFAEQLEAVQPEVLLLQEVRALPEQLPKEWQAPEGWHAHWHPAEKKGYSGTAILSRHPMEVVHSGLSARDPDSEGRVLTVRIRDLKLSSVYLPSGSSSEDRQKIKDEWLPRFRRWLDRHRDDGPWILGGDLNIAHTERDIFHWKSNQQTSGFLPHEREWFGKMLNAGWHDLIREKAGEVDGPYSWWSNRGKARELDRGWRIDYLLANPEARKLVVDSHINREAGLAVSDHAPVSADLKLPSAA